MTVTKLQHRSDPECTEHSPCLVLIGMPWDEPQPGTIVYFHIIKINSHYIHCSPESIPQYALIYFPDSKVHGANMGPTWVPVGPRWAPCRPREPCYLCCYSAASCSKPPTLCVAVCCIDHICCWIFIIQSSMPRYCMWHDSCRVRT